MGAFAFERDIESGRRGHGRGLMKADEARLHLRRIMKSQDDVHRWIVENAVVDHRRRAGQRFFRRLKDEFDPAAHFAAQRRDTRATPSTITVCTSWPHACIFPATCDANGSPGRS